MPTVEWQTLGNVIEDGKPSYTQRFTITGGNGVARVCFNQFARKMEAVNPADTIREIIPGYYYISSPRLGSNTETIIDIKTSATLRHHSYMPDGVHAVMANGSVAPVRFTRLPISDRPEQWSLPNSDKMPSAESTYTLNESLRGGKEPSEFDLIPSLKKVELRGEGKANLNAAPKETAITHENPEYYQIDLTGEVPAIAYASERGKIYAFNTLQQLRNNNPNGVSMAWIEDYPDLPYRAFMMDIARNYFGIPQLQQLVQQMARYKLNKLHFHFCDDEAWRLEIPSLPELITVGSRRGYTLDEKEHLAQIFDGNGNPNSSQGTANGYITRQEFVQFLQYCKSLGIDVIPEIESPGHARAAIKAMENRYRRTGDASLRLIEDGDKSVYTSAQSFHDNIMNPAIEGPYKFMEIVISDIEAMYKDAGVTLETIHIGGDEVPKNAWGGSPSVQAMIKEQNLDGERGVHAAFVERIAEILNKKGIGMNGWQEIAIGHSADYDKKIAPLTRGVNFWTVSKSSKAPEAAAAGYKIIISNVDHFYLDQTYSNHPEEKGLTWGGNVDEFATLHGYPSKLCPVDSAYAKNVIGVSGQIFGETLRSFEQLQTYLFPKWLGLAERGWNANPSYNDKDFNRFIEERELPSLALRGIHFHVKQPGIKVEDGMIVMNAPYSSGTIRYTTDGSNPTEKSPIYTTPFTDNGAEQIRATFFFKGMKSVPTIHFRK